VVNKLINAYKYLKHDVQCSKSFRCFSLHWVKFQFW